MLNPVIESTSAGSLSLEHSSFDDKASPLPLAPISPSPDPSVPSSSTFSPDLSDIKTASPQAENETKDDQDINCEKKIEAKEKEPKRVTIKLPEPVGDPAKSTESLIVPENRSITPTTERGKSKTTGKTISGWL